MLPWYVSVSNRCVNALNASSGNFIGYSLDHLFPFQNLKSDPSPKRRYKVSPFLKYKHISKINYYKKKLILFIDSLNFIYAITSSLLSPFNAWTASTVPLSLQLLQSWRGPSQTISSFFLFSSPEYFRIIISADAAFCRPD